MATGLRWLNNNKNDEMPYDVDYFRYYQLNTQYYNTDALIANNAQLSAFTYGVRRNITIGNGTSAISLNA
jgi:hypothetical protein